MEKNQKRFLREMCSFPEHHVVCIGNVVFVTNGRTYLSWNFNLDAFGRIEQIWFRKVDKDGRIGYFKPVAVLKVKKWK